MGNCEKVFFDRYTFGLSRTRQLQYLPILILLTCSMFSCSTDSEIEAAFKILPPTQTNIHFSNNLTETEDFNIIQYLYYYNGGGVAIGDINNDSLPDIFFSGNQVGNKLYINKGQMTFEDQTEKAGVACLEAWNTGVNMVDVNNDGWLDIYICQLGDYKTIKGRNQLFINNKNRDESGQVSFTERAEEYGIAFQGFSTQAAFFDYDNDGDLDLYLLNHSVHDQSNYRNSSIRNVQDSLAGDRLYKNEKGKFVEVTKAAGILSSKIGFGLGIAVADINGDNCMDIYVSNDFHENDYLYYNNCDGSFTEGIAKSTNHLSQFSMGSDIADLNNDGLPDILTLDMKPESEVVLKNSVGADAYDIFEFKHRNGYQYQYPRNMLQLNRGKLDGTHATFSEIGQLAGIAATDWSWSPLIFDFDNNGSKDIFISNGIVRRPNDLDYLKFIASPQVQQKASDLEMAKEMPSGKSANYFYQNQDDLSFKNIKEKVIDQKPSISTGAAYADLDNDGDLDVVTNNIDQAAFVYENQEISNNFLKVKLTGRESNHFSIGAKVWVFTDDGVQYQELSPVRGFMSSSDYVLNFGLNYAENVDSLIVLWNTGNRKIFYDLKINTLYHFEESNDSKIPETDQDKPLFKNITSPIDFKHRENLFYDINRENLMPYLLSTQGPAAAVADVNNDGLDDFFIGGTKQQSATLFIQKTDGQFEKSNRNTWRADRFLEDVDALFFDADNDGDQDLYVVTGGNEFEQGSKALGDRLYLNNGLGIFTPSYESIPVFENGSCVRAADYDGDGDLDLFVGSRSVPGIYGLSPASYLLENDGQGKFINTTEKLLPELSKIGMVTDARWADIDQNGYVDLIVVGEWMPVTIFKNKGGSFDTKFEMPNTSGWWQSIAAEDMDGDGDVDLIGGNFGLNNNLASEAGIVQLFLGDFDNNKSPEAILTYDRANTTYTFASKDELVGRMASFRKQFPKYGNFSKKGFYEIFDKRQIDAAIRLEAENFASSYFENTGKGDFSKIPFSIEAQFSTNKTMLIEDFNKDGHKDILFAGNFFEVQPSIGRQDASLGCLLLGDKTGNFTPMSPSQSGLHLNGPIRKLLRIKTPNQKNNILVIQNNGPVRFLTY